MALSGIQISSLVETTTSGQSFLTFDVTVSGHLISTICVRHQSGRPLWAMASVYGFAEFDLSDHRAMEQKIRKSWSSRARKARIH